MKVWTYVVDPLCMVNIRGLKIKGWIKKIKNTV